MMASIRARRCSGPGACILTLAVWMGAAGTWAQDPSEYIEEITPPRGPGATDRPDRDRPRPKKKRDGDKPAARPARAAPTPDGADAKLGAPGDLDGEGAEGVDLTPRSYAGLVERWDARLLAVQSGEVSKERRAESELINGTRAFGVQGVPYGPQALDFAWAFVHEAQKARGVGDAERAERLLHTAGEWAPSLAAVPLERARLALSDKTDVFGALGAMIDAVTTHLLRSPDGQVRSTLVLSAGVALSGLILLWLVALVVVWRTFPMLSYDVLTVLPRGAAQWQVMVLMALLVAAPLVAGLGPVFTPLLWLTLSWVYLSRRTRQTVVLIGVLAALTPLLLDVSARLLSYPDSLAQVRHGARIDVAGADLRAQLLARPPEQLEVIELAALADDAFRQGQLDVAKQLAGRLNRRLPDAGWVKNDLGAIAGVTGRPDVAHAEFQSALQKDPDLVAAGFNLSVSALRDPTGRLQAPKEAVALVEAHLEDRERMRNVTFQAGDKAVPHNQLFARAAPKVWWLEDAVTDPGPGAEQVRDEWLGALFMGLSRNVAAGAAGGALLGWLLLTLFFRRFEPSRPCERCGQPSSPRYDAADVPAGTCASCFHVFYRSGQVDAKVRVQKERQVRDHRSRESRATRLLALVFAGAGHVWMGQGGWAVLGLLLMALSVGLGAAAYALPRLTVMPLVAIDVALLVPVLVVGLVLYLLTVRDAFARSE